MTILVTGGAGFIGGNFVLDWCDHNEETVINLDALTYAGNLNTLTPLKENKNHIFIHGSITDSALVNQLLEKYQPRAMLCFAAESHVDRSINGPKEFINTNIIGTFTLLESARVYWNKLVDPEKSAFRFLHVSTDEVYGSLSPEDPPFSETTPYQPNSPYSASKAASDHLTRAWFHTYGLPTLTTNCSNNYGPFHFPEKLIPLTILNALNGYPIPVYGDGAQVRDWLYVKDHCSAICSVLENGKIGETYNIGGFNEKTNLEVVETICNILDNLKPKTDGVSYRNQIAFVNDRPGHDKRYAIDPTKIQHNLGWTAQKTFESGIEETVRWYLNNNQWWQSVLDGSYSNERFDMINR